MEKTWTRNLISCPKIFYFSFIALANGVLVTPHLVSKSRIRPYLCQAVIIPLIIAWNLSSPNCTASPQGASSIVAKGIS